MPEAEKRLKMDKATIIVCSVVGSLGVLSAILGFSAEGTKLTPYTILLHGHDCIYPQNPALGLGVCAIIFLVVAQVTFSAAGGCCGCCKSRSIPSETKRIVGIVCAVFSWIAAVIAWALLIEGASWNANVVRVAAPYCPYLKDGVFAGAGVLTLAATALGITSFIMLRQQPVAPAAAVGTTPGEQSPPAGGCTGNPLLPQPMIKPQQRPSKAPVVHPTSANRQGYEEAPQNQQSPSPPAAQGNGYHSHAPNQAEFPAQGRPADAAAPAAASAPPELGHPGGVLPPPLGVATGQPVVPLPLPQVYGPNDTPQYAIPIPIPAPQVGVEIPGPAVPSTAPQQQGYGQVIGQEIARAGVKLIARVVQDSLFSDNTATPTTLSDAGDILLSVMTDPTVGALVEATN